MPLISGIKDDGLTPQAVTINRDGAAVVAVPTTEQLLEEQNAILRQLALMGKLFLEHLGIAVEFGVTDTK